MDYHNDFSPRGMGQETTGLKQSQHLNDKEEDDAENQLVKHFQHAVLEENVNNDWPLNGQKYDYQEEGQRDSQSHHVELDTADHAGNHNNVSCIEDYAKTERIQSVYVNDMLNSNRQTMESK